MSFSKAIEDGVRAGFEKALSGGSFQRAVDSAFAPVRSELDRLRKIERLYRWHLIEKIPQRRKDGNAVLLARCGDVMWGCWSEEGQCWDADIEYGGSPIDPPPDHYFPVPGAPNPTPKEPSHDQ